MAKATLIVSPKAVPSQPNISALARTHGVSRRTIRRWQNKGWASPTPAAVEILPKEQAVPTIAQGGGRRLGAVLVILSVSISGLALAINGQFGHSLGTTPAAALTFMGLAVAADALAIALPATAAALWHAHHRMLAVAAWGVWAAVASLAVLASLGFAEHNIGDTAAGRRAIVVTATASANQRSARIEAAKVAADAAKRAREGECVRRGSMCRDREADERVALAALAAAISAPIVATPMVDADPQVTAATRLGTWAGLPVTADGVANIRLVLMVAVPNLAGLVLAFGMALRRRRD
jgi:hypothetical protein